MLDPTYSGVRFMTSRTLAAGLLAAGCLTAAAAGSYVAVRQNAVEAQPAAPVSAPAEAPPVSETEGVLTPPEQPKPESSPSPAVETERETPPAPARRRAAPRQAPATRPAPMRASATPEPIGPTTPPPVEPASPPPLRAGVPAATASNEVPTVVEPPADPLPAERRVEPIVDQLVLPSS